MFFKYESTKWSILLVALIGLIGASCGGEDQTPPGPDAADMITITGMIKRTMSISMGGDLGTAYANEPTETLISESDEEYPLRRMPGCRVINEKPSPPGVITLGAQGPYEVKGVIVDGVFEAYQLSFLTNRT